MNLKNKNLYQLNPKTKICTACNNERDIADFSKQTKSHDGLAQKCKHCYKVYHQEWYKKNREKQKKIVKEYRKKNPDSHRASHLKRVYGITIKQYNKMFLKQKGCCKICGTHQSELSKRLFVDHCHDSGKVRALLCHSCNSALGLLKEDIKILNKMIDYIDGFERFT